MANDTIATVFTHKGQSRSKADTMAQLVKFYQKDPHRKQKAAAAIGGAVSHGYIKYSNGSYECQRNPVNFTIVVTTP